MHSHEYCKLTSQNDFKEIRLESLNQSLYLAINANPDASWLMISLAKAAAEWPIIIAVSLVVFVVAGHKETYIKSLLVLGFSVFLAMLTTYLIRKGWHHPRPFMIGLGTNWLSHAPTSSFPSFHATFLFSLGFSLLHTGLSKLAAGFVLLLATITAWARIYLGVHYPFDMLAAIIVAAVSAFLVSSAYNRFLKYKNAI